MARQDYQGAPIPGGPPQPERPVATTTSYKVNNPTEKELNSSNASGEGPSLQLNYPLEDQDNYKAAINFGVYSIDPYEIDTEAAKKILDRPFLSELSSNISKGMSQSATDDVTTAKATNGASNTDDAYKTETAKVVSDRVARETSYSTNRDLGLTPKPLKKNVRLYFPPGVQLMDAVQIDNTATLGTGGAATLAGLRNQSGIINSLKQGVTEGLSDLFNLLKGDLANQEAAQIAATRAFNKLPSGGVQNATRIALQKVMNPNTRAMFQGVPIREFSFAFKMIATSQAEAKEITDIIKLFRTELYPEAISIGTLPVGFKFPNLFKVQFMYNDRVNRNLPQPLMCYLRNVSTTYNQGSMVFHEDGQPTEVDLTLSFTEFRALTRQDIIYGSETTPGWGH
jgi:hypothetical protein